MDQTKNEIMRKYAFKKNSCVKINKQGLKKYSKKKN